jgi:hypothetical protein
MIYRECAQDDKVWSILAAACYGHAEGGDDMLIRRELDY